MAVTSAVIMYSPDAPHEATHVAVLGGDSAKAGQHAGNVAAARGFVIGGPTWETDERLNGGRPYRLYRLRPDARAS